MGRPLITLLAFIPILHFAFYSDDAAYIAVLPVVATLEQCEAALKRRIELHNDLLPFGSWNIVDRECRPTQ